VIRRRQSLHWLTPKSAITLFWSVSRAQTVGSGAVVWRGRRDIDLIDTQTGEWVLEQEPGVGRRWKSAFSADGKLIVVVDIIDTAGKALVYDVVTGRKLHHIETKSVEMGVASGGSCLVSVFHGSLNGKRNDKASSDNYGLRYSILNLP